MRWSRPRRNVRKTVMLACSFALMLALPLTAKASGIDPRFSGVELAELSAPLAAEAQRAILATNPAGLASIDAIVLVDDELDHDDADAGLDYGVLVVDVIGRPVQGDDLAPSSVPAVTRSPVGKHPRRVRRREVTPEIVRMEIPYVTGLDASVVPRVGAARERERFAYADLKLAIHVSTGDRVVLLEDPRRGFRRVFPADVGAIDTIRNPGVTASLTPATDGARIRRESSYEALGAPVWFKNEPFLTLEAPTGWVTAQGTLKRAHYATRVGFHIYTTTVFHRGYMSQGCVALRETDLNALADALYFGPESIPVAIQASPLPDVYHPFPPEEGLHYVLKNVGTAEKPRFTTRGGLYLVEKQAGAPPEAQELADVYMDGERRLQEHVAVAVSRRVGARGRSL
ncbi:MAG: hypothetical protein KC635_20975 [Myxococcales bacterium]|nr:hypothetical protein [Myxococcales bacterium]MCB9734240.1 hypothetical protein [Deltaproteobacteria bacterium]